MELQSIVVVGNLAFSVWVAWYLLTTQTKIMVDLKDAVEKLTFLIENKIMVKR